jgi:hypothetical protein
MGVCGKLPAMPLTAKDMKQAYEIYQGNFFEGSWMDNPALSAAVGEWAGKQPWAKGLVGRAGPFVEIYVKDELSKPELIADFVNELPDALRAEALAGLAEDVASMVEGSEDEDDGAKLLARIKALIP